MRRVVLAAALLLSGCGAPLKPAGFAGSGAFDPVAFFTGHETSWGVEENREGQPTGIVTTDCVGTPDGAGGITMVQTLHTGGKPMVRTWHLRRIGADTRAHYVGFKCADRYYSSLDMATALHPQTILALDYGAGPLPDAYGFPVKLRVPTKLGFKNPKHIVAMFVTNEYPGGYWEDQGYNWFSGS